MKLTGIELEGTYKVRCFATCFEVYDEKGKVIYLEHSNGYWAKWEYNEKGNAIYFEDSNSFWAKWEYDEKGNKIYFEDSNDYKIKIKGEKK